jgi:hypothetical protein
VPERITPAAPDYSAIAKEMPSPAPTTEKPAAAPAAAPVEGAPVEKSAEGAPAEPETKPTSEGAGTPFEKGFARLASAQSEFRQQKEAAKHGLNLARVVSPLQAAALEKAMASNDPLAAMNALGYSYADIASRVAGAPARPPEKKVEEPEVKPEVKSEDPDLAAMKEHWKQTKMAEQKSVILGGIKEVITKAADKFKNIAGLEDFEGVRSIIDSMWDPEAKAFVGGATGVEVIQIAAEEYERRLRDGEVTLTRKQWEKMQNLTAPASSGSTGLEATRDRPGNATVSAKTLTNKAGAPVAPTKTRPAGPDYEALARELP